MVKVGDVFLTKLKRDFWGAFKVLKVGKSFFRDDLELLLIGVLDIIDVVKPQITDKRLNNILLKNRFFYENEYCIAFFVANEKYNGINNYEFLGNVPLTNFENELKFKLGHGRDGVAGGWPQEGSGIDDYFVNHAFYEWRWLNEREDYEKEHERVVEENNRKRQEFYKNRLQEPKKMMTENLFWEVISFLNWKESDDEKIIEPAVKYLSKLKVSDIKQFEESLTYKLYCLDTKVHARNIGEHSYKEKDSHFSEDLFLYVRCAAVANGKLFFEEALKNPEKMPRDIDFEALVTIAPTAYELKTKKEFEYAAGCDYETYSNKAGWK